METIIIVHKSNQYRAYNQSKKTWITKWYGNIDYLHRLLNVIHMQEYDLKIINYM